MPVETGEVRTTELRWPRAWMMLFRAFQLARDPYKIVIAAGAVIVLTFGWWILAGIFGPNEHLHGQWPANANRGPNPFLVVLTPERRAELYSGPFWIGDANREPPLQIEPFRQFFQPVIDLIRYAPIGPTWRNWWYSFFGVALTLIVWGIAAGAITRIAAVQLARNERIGLGEALGFAWKKLFDYILGPAIPLIIAAILAILNAIGGELTQVPYLGSIVVAILLPLPILSCLIIAAMVIAFIGWPLFYATISAEGSDSFDALSRTLAYITQRAWSYVKYVFIAIVYSIIVVFIVVFLASFTVYLVRWSVGLAPGLGWQDTGDPVGSMFTLAPRSYHWRDLLVNRIGREHPLVHDYQVLNLHLAPNNDVEAEKHLEAFKQGLKEKRPFDDKLIPSNVYDQLEFKDKPLTDAQYAVLAEFYQSKTVEDLRNPDTKYDYVWAYMNWGQKAAAGVIAFWTHLLFLFLVGFAYSLFWCLGMIIYFLLRKEVDETEYEEVYIEDEDELVPPPVPPAPGGTQMPSSSAPVPPPPPPATGSNEALPATVPPKLPE